jgi:hypothetical protein
MKFSTPLSILVGTAPKSTGRMVKKGAAALLFGILLSTTPLLAEEPGNGTHSDKEMIQTLQHRLEQLEARVAQLEASRQPAASSAPPPASGQTTVPPVAEPETEPEPERPEPERMDLGKTLMRIRGFGDVTLHGSDQKTAIQNPTPLNASNTSFSMGQLNLFITSDISDKFSYLSEIVFEAGEDNVFGVDVERMLLQYSQSDYLKIAIGRYHTAIGYYNTAYHHSTWLQTATGRPFLFQFEDSGGILPIHNVGVSVSGLIPSGPLGLHYVAEVGNGRASRSPASEPVQNVVDENNGKAVNLALFARPEAIRGLQLGFSVYHDGLQPANGPHIGELIFDAHAVMERPSFEWLNEALLIRHAQQGVSHVYDTPGFYTQISKRFGSYRPYFRYQYVNESDSEPMFPDVGLQYGPSIGLRYDASEAVAVKFQYDHTSYRHQQPVNGLAAQVGFTF